MKQTPSVADYVVVGSGSAGAALAERLSADSRNAVVVLEAGPEDKNKFAHIPAAFSKLFRSEVDWDYLTEPQDTLGGREIYWPRGKMLGGSSSMNAMMWVRGFAADYDEWAELADESWSFREVLKHFRRIEKVEGATEADCGIEGPINVCHQRSPRALTGAFLDAVRETGYPVERANTAQPEGFSQTMVTQKRGARWSTADAYLRPAMKRKNLTVVTEALATRVLFDGTAAVGVEYEKGGARHTVRAAKEVILAGGAINTPQLLMLSGVGDEQQLREHGIPVQHHLPEVGKNLADHLVSFLGYSVDSDSLYAAEKIPELINYLTRRRGMLTSNVAEAYGFVRSRDDLPLPDLEMIYGPAPFFDEGLIPATGHAAVIGTILVKPESRGTITLRSADPAAKPIIDPRYLSDPEGADRRAMLEGLRLCDALASAPTLKSKLGTLIRPSVEPDTPLEEILERALAENAHTLYHPVGTCRMGKDPASVVTPDLRVRGVERLRIADASIMPTIIRGHTHAPAVLIGERAADLIGR
ncbi:GMC family oxidoreductase N-terminal domain-containing protein [Rhodococcus sp. USK13]|jgi:choline dehydrogenase|uniref:GMC family oxidoreductase n=1 Tax=Rhodococcus sp. USK13 TaxID=2806442 RepID=UPI001BCC9E60|nr:GMC family oxidoreductase N-terminal domain-containing protein [Rhodococcus sp. USK13]